MDNLEGVKITKNGQELASFKLTIAYSRHLLPFIFGPG